MIFEMGIAAAEFQFHVLAVDDSLIDRKLIERLLRTSSYQVTTVDSGNKALEFLGLNEDNNPRNSNIVPVSPYKHQEMEVNLVITDYCMPGMTGYDLLKKIKESSSLKSIPVVIMSSENVPSRINRCLEEGAEEFLLKPVRLSDMNKLKPHLMKSKCSNNFDDQKPIEQEETKTTRVSSSPDASFPGISEFIKPKQQQQYMQQQQQQQQQQHHSETEPDSNKRKPVDEEGVLPERTKQKFNGLPVVSHL